MVVRFTFHLCYYSLYIGDIYFFSNHCTYVKKKRKKQTKKNNSVLR